MVMVGTDRAEVERALVSGELSCPVVSGGVGPVGTCSLAVLARAGRDGQASSAPCTL